MNKTKEPSGFLRYAAGYLIGIVIFLGLIPLGIWSMAASEIRIFSLPVIPHAGIRLVLAAFFFFLGCLFVLWSNLFLVLRGKGGPTDIAGIEISPRTKKLVSDGPYRYTRNPMVFGVHSLYFSLTLFLNSLGCLLVLAFFYFTIVRWVVLQEEKRLLKDFGSEYAAYREKTSMFFPHPHQRSRKG